MSQQDGIVTNREQMPFFGPTPPTVTDDPAWQPIRDPLDAKKKVLRNRASVITRDIPNMLVQTGWTVDEVRGAISSLVLGNFDAPSQLFDGVLGDSRVQSAMQSRVGGLMGRELRHTIPAHLVDSSIAKECHAAWCAHWPSMATEPVMRDMLSKGCGLGFQLSQMLWDTSKPVWLPYLVPFSERYTYYQWQYRTLVAITQDAQVPIFGGGDGHWVLHAPNGQHRGWMYGALRAIAPWWLARNYALRDWARYSERHGMPIGLAITPSGASKEDIAAYRQDLSRLGQESILQLPQADEADIGKYDFKWAETSGAGWQGFKELIAQCNAEITLAVLGQNLTSEVKEGSFAAARVHADVRQAILESDARALSQTIYTQIGRPFAALNFGDADLAPRSTWDIIPYEDNKALADTLSQFAIAVSSLKNSGYVFRDITAFGREFGLSLSVGGIEVVAVPNQKTELITPSDKAAIVKVGEAREDAGLPADGFGPEASQMSVAQFKAFNEKKGEAEGTEEGGGNEEPTSEDEEPIDEAAE